MEHKNGFTLVELLAVIVILAIVLIIAVPGVLTIIQQTRTKAYESQLEMIKEATRTYVMAGNLEWRENKIVVNLSDLQAQGYLDKKLIDPRDRSELKGISVVVTRLGNQIQYSVVYTDQSGANYPVFSRNMIPIVYKDGKWVKADPSNENQSWFDYSKQKWANVATVSEDVRQTLLTADADTEIPMDKITTMFTWIPRYHYRLWNVSGTSGPDNNSNLVGNKVIDVQFEGSKTSKQGGTQNGEWLTHPAFTFGDKEIAGFWMSKFEYSSAEGNTDTELGDNVTTKTIQVKPNVSAWRYQTLKNMYLNGRRLTEDGNPYGLIKEQDSHLIKNSEWGAMLYLTSSVYGKSGTEDDRIGVNTNNAYLTGCGMYTPSGVSATTSACDPYDQGGVVASTTGNITGIYDTTGGSFDMTMAVQYYPGNQHLAIGRSGFTQEELDGIDSRYLDRYQSVDSATAIESYLTSHLGDGIKEFGPFSEVKESSNGNQYREDAWYGSNQIFSTTEFPYFIRGGRYDYSITARFNTEVFYVGNAYAMVGGHLVLV